MAETQWFVEGDDDAALELQGRKYATGDSGAPMLCSLLCETLGRHVHIDACRPDENGQCVGLELEHMRRSGAHKDWITHRLFWARSGESHYMTVSSILMRCFFRFQRSVFQLELPFKRKGDKEVRSLFAREAG